LADLTEAPIDTTQGGSNATLNIHSTVNVHLKDGSLIPFQANDDHSAKTTTDLLQKPISIIAHRDESGFAAGTLFLDQGISRKEINDWDFEYYNIQLQAQSFQFKLAQGHSGSQNHILDKLMIVNAADLSDTNFACLFDNNMKSRPMTVNFVKEKNLLEITPADEDPLMFHDVSNVYFGSSDKGDVNLCDPLTY
jgi:hypothetical protein